MATAILRTIQKTQRQQTSTTKRLLGQVRAIRQKISRASGRWNAVEVIRSIRYAR